MSVIESESARLAGRYRLFRQLGTGGMSRVWLGRDEMLHREVAIKEIRLPDGLIRSELDELQRLTLREARAAARLSHPNVIGVYDVLHTEERPWIVMEYVPSRSLMQVVHEDGPLSPQQTARIGLRMLAALRAAHAAGVLHRDVKPANVLLADDGRVVLTDFGLAVFARGEGVLTVPGLVRGSPQYMSPERVQDGIAGQASDLWSLGATLYTAVEGRSPYARDTVAATLAALVTKPPDPAPHAGPLKPVLDGLLRKDPERRLSPAEVERELRRVAAQPSQPVTTSRRPSWFQALRRPIGAIRPRRRIPRRVVVAIGAAVALVALAVPAAAVISQQVGDAERDPSLTSGPPVESTAPVAGVPVCPPATGPVPVSEAEHDYALVDGWVWYDDPSGFSVAVPQGWSYATGGSTVCFREPGAEGAAGRLLAVGALPPGRDDLVEYWTHTERTLTTAGRLPGYEQIAITERNYHGAAADWEFTYDAGEARQHAIARGFRVADGLAYAIYWITPEFDWQVNRNYFDLVVASFTPPVQTRSR
jgi:tRNA A-37 threonylcarbamoyl transferase component Bud32